MKTKLSFFFFLIAILSFSQELTPVNNYEPSSQQTGNQNWMVSESFDNFIYVANNKGLLEYNGSQWTLYRTPNESIMRSVKAAGDRIYTGCYMDFGYWKKDGAGKLQYTSIVEQSGFKVKEDEQFWEIVVKKDYVLFQSRSRIYTYDIATGGVNKIVDQNEINKFFQVGDSYYYQILDEGLYKVKNKQPKLISASEFFLKTTVILMFEYKSQEYLITQDAKIYLFKDGDVTLVGTCETGKNITVYNATLLSNDTILLGTIANGVISINITGEVNYILNQSNGLANNTCLFIFEDSAQNVWFGLDNGISSINIDSPYKVYIDKDGSLGTVYASYQSADLLYLGTNQGLFYKKNDEQHFNFIEGTAGQVWSFFAFNGALFCNHHSGVFIIDDTIAQRIDKTIGTWQLYPIPNHQNLILAGTYKGLHILENVNDDWKFRNKIQGFDISSRDIVALGDLIYVNHEYKGVFKIRLKNDFKNIKELEKLDDLGKGIGSDLIEYNGKIYFSKRDSIFIQESPGKSFLIHAELSKLVHHDLYTSGSLIKMEGYLWLFNKRSIHKINIEDINGGYKIENIPLSYELRKEKVGYENFSKIGPKKYLMGTSYGYISIDENFDYATNHKVYLNNMIRYDKNVPNYIDLSTSVDLPNENNSLQLFYSSPFYETFRTIEYQYRLLGKGEDHWSPWSKEGSTSIQNLDFGDYTFEVRSRVNSAISENVANINFTVAKPFYLSSVAIGLYIMLLVIIVLILNGFYSWYFKKQKRIILNEQQKELELKNLTNEKNLIELRNAKLRSDIEHRNKELAISTMAMIKKNETLKELKDELDHLPKSKESNSIKKMLDKNLNSKQDWLTFEEAFNNADKDFFKKIKELHPSLTSGDLRLCVYLRLNLSSKEIAPLLNISPRSVEIKRYRLRKKLALPHDHSLTSYIVEI